MLKRLIAVLVLSAPLWAQLGVPDFPTAPKANPAITNTTFPYVATSANCPWVKTHFDLASGSAVSCTGAGNAVFTQYADALNYITWWYRAGADYCDSVGLTDCNNRLFIHPKRDYYSSAPWTALSGMFDWAENTSTGNIADNGQAVHGAFRVRGGVYTDVTCGLFGAVSGCGTQPNGPIALLAGDYLLLGYWQPFTEANFVLNTVASGATVTWEYSTGSGTWASLSVTDGTSNLNNSGLVTFIAPDDTGTKWVRDIFSGSQKKYWIRLHITGSGVTFTSVRNANASNVSAMLTNNLCVDCGGHNANMRGWSQVAWAASTACSGVPCTVDGIPYNPSPPSTCPGSRDVCATAQFPYQGAGNFYGGNPDRFWMNSDNFIGSVTPANNILAQQLAFKDSLPGLIRSGYTGVMQDNVGSLGAATATTPPMSTLVHDLDLHCNITTPTCTVAGVQGDEGSGGVYGFTPAFTAANTQVAAAQAPGFLVAWNSSGPSSMGQTAPVYYNEFCNRSVASPHGIPWQALDDPLSSGNTLGSVLYCQMIDPTKYANFQDPGFPTVWHIFDSDRGAKNGFSEFLMGTAWCQSSRTNCFTGSSYDYNYTGYLWDTSANASYTTTDEVGQYQNSSTLANPVAADSSGVGVTITLVDGSGVLPVGGPYFATVIQGRLCPTPTTCNSGDKVALSRTGTNTFVTKNVTGSGAVPPILQSYAAGATFQFATTSTLHTLGSPPPWSNVGTWWALWQPILGVDVGKPDITGYNNGVRSCGSFCATTFLPSPPAVFKAGSAITCIGHAGLDGCSPSAPAVCAHGSNHGDLWRRDFVNAAGQHNIILVRDYGFQWCTDDFDWPSQNIDLSSANPSCAPACSYQSLHSDGTLDPAASTYNMPAGSALILMQVTGAPPALTITSGACPSGTVGVPYNCYLTASGGTLPYTWSISAGSLCGWATLTTVANVGVISGTPTLNSCSFTEKVTDFALATATQPNSITVNGATDPTSIKGTVTITGSVVIK